MRVAAFLPTHDLAEEAMPWMDEVRKVFDDLVIFVDEKRVTPGTMKRASKLATRLYQYKADTWYQWDLAAMVRQCESDWVFLIERDEQLSPEWRDGAWRRLLENTDITHFWIPRRWNVSGNKFLPVEPWWPDFQLRLFRSNTPGTTFPDRLHDTIYVPGPGARLRSLALNHHVLWLCPRHVREERMQYYEQLRPGGALGHYYLYENYRVPEVPLPAGAAVDLTREVIRMERLTPEEILKISLEVSAVPREIGASEMFWPCARVTNHLDRAICNAPPHPVRLGYHWLEKSARQMVLFEGARSGLFPGTEANDVEQHEMTILAPEQPGEYILQTTMVQEGVNWFEDVRPDILQEFDVSVTGGAGRQGALLAPWRRTSS
jgi:hypothetical protein